MGAPHTRGGPGREPAGGLQSEWQMLFSSELPRASYGGCRAPLPSRPVPSRGQRPRPQALTPSPPLRGVEPRQTQGLGCRSQNPFPG